MGFDTSAPEIQSLSWSHFLHSLCARDESSDNAFLSNQLILGPVTVPALWIGSGKHTLYNWCFFCGSGGGLIDASPMEATTQHPNLNPPPLLVCHLVVVSSTKPSSVIQIYPLL